MSKENVNSFIASAGILMTKNSPLKELFDKVILRLLNGGIVDHITESYYWFWQPDSPEDTLKPIGFSHLTISVGILSFGLILGLASFVMEIIKFKLKV